MAEYSKPDPNLSPSNFPYPLSHSKSSLVLFMEIPSLLRVCSFCLFQIKVQSLCTLNLKKTSSSVFFIRMEIPSLLCCVCLFVCSLSKSSHSADGSYFSSILTFSSNSEITTIEKAEQPNGLTIPPTHTQKKRTEVKKYFMPSTQEAPK